MNRRYLWLAVLVVFAFAAGIGYGIYKNNKISMREVSVDLPKGVRVSVYKDLGGDGAANYDANDSVESLSASGTISIKTGSYIFAIESQPNQYKNPFSRETIDQTTSKITIKPTYSDEKLSELLPEARSAALTALYAKYPLLKQNYTIAGDGIYELGNWYGVTLIPKNPTFDTVKMIMKLENGSWKPAIGHPMISVGQPSNPTIPLSVLQGVNSL